MFRPGLFSLALLTLILVAGAAAVVLRPVPTRYTFNDTPATKRQPTLKDELPPLIPKEPAEALKTFRTIDGFQVELVAQEPQVTSPVAAAFDENGRLFVAERRRMERHDVPRNTDHLRRLCERAGDHDHSRVRLQRLRRITHVLGLERPHCSGSDLPSRTVLGRAEFLSSLWLLGRLSDRRTHDANQWALLAAQRGKGPGDFPQLRRVRRRGYRGMDRHSALTVMTQPASRPRYRETSARRRKPESY